MHTKKYVCSRSILRKKRIRWSFFHIYFIIAINYPRLVQKAGKSLLFFPLYRWRHKIKKFICSNRCLFSQKKYVCSREPFCQKTFINVSPCHFLKTWYVYGRNIFLNFHLNTLFVFFKKSMYVVEASQEEEKTWIISNSSTPTVESGWQTPSHRAPSPFTPF